MKKNELIDITSIISYQGDYYPYFKFDYLIKGGEEFEIYDDYITLNKVERNINDGCDKSLFVADAKTWIEKSFVKLLLQKYFNLNPSKYNYTFLFEKEELEEDTGVTNDMIFEDLENKHIVNTLQVILGLHQRELLNIDDGLLEIAEKVINDAEQEIW